jgi:hypothetical protein
MASLAVRNGHPGFRRWWLSSFTSLWRRPHSKGGRCNRRQNPSFIRASIRGSTFILPVANFSGRGWSSWRREESRKLTQISTARNRGNGTAFSNQSPTSRNIIFVQRWRDITRGCPPRLALSSSKLTIKCVYAWRLLRLWSLPTKIEANLSVATHTRTQLSTTVHQRRLQNSEKQTRNSKNRQS